MTVTGQHGVTWTKRSSFVGVIAYSKITAAGIELNVTLVPSLLAGPLLAAVVAPFSVRVLPNPIYKYVISGYTSGLG